MPATRLLTFVFDMEEALILKDAGPEIFFQSHSLIVPSGSLDADPSNEMLSVGKVIPWSGPAMAMGGLLPFIHSSHAVSFLQETKIIVDTHVNADKKRKLFFIK